MTSQPFNDYEKDLEERDKLRDLAHGCVVFVALIVILSLFGCESSSVSPEIRELSRFASGSERESDSYAKMIHALASSDEPSLIVDHHVVTCTFLLGGPCTCPARADSTKAAIKNKLPVMFPGFGFPMGMPNGWQY